MNDPRPTVKERFDALVKLAEFEMEVRKERRHHEWRVSLGLWVGLAGGMITFRDHPISKLALGLCLFVVVAVHIFLWVQSNYKRNERDAQLAYFYLTQAEKLFPYPGRPPRPPLRDYKWYRWFKELDGPPMVEAVTTIVLAAIWYFVVNTAPPSQWVPY